MSSAPIRFCSSTSTERAASASPAASAASNATTGWTSMASRSSVHSPPFTTRSGTPGSGTIEPNSPFAPANSNWVT